MQENVLKKGLELPGPFFGVVIGVVFGVVVLLPPCSSMIEVDYVLTSFKYAPIP